MTTSQHWTILGGQYDNYDVTVWGEGGGGGGEGITYPGVYDGGN